MIRAAQLALLTTILSLAGSCARYQEQPITENSVKQQLTKRHGFAIDSNDLATLRYVDSIFFISGPNLNYSSGSGRGGGFGGRGGRGMPSFADIAIQRFFKFRLNVTSPDPRRYAPSAPGFENAMRR